MLILYDVSNYKRERPTTNEEHTQVGLAEKRKRECSGECYMQGFRIFVSWCCYLPPTFSCVSNVSRMATMTSCPGCTKLKGSRLLGWCHTLNQPTLSRIIRSGTYFQREDRSLRKLQDLFLSSVSFFKHLYLYVCIHVCRTSLVAQAVNYLPAVQCRRPGFNPWVWKIPWRMEWQLTPVFLPGESHGQRSLVGYSSQCHKKLDMTKRLITHAYMYACMYFWLCWVFVTA